MPNENHELRTSWPRLNAQAKETLRWAGITQVAWAREHCDERDDCHCLPVLIGDYRRKHGTVTL